MSAKMTPGPWRVGDAGRTVFGPPNGNPAPETIASDLKRANARAIACLPELIEAARHVMAMKNDAYLTGHPEWNSITEEMCHILTRIDGEEA